MCPLFPGESDFDQLGRLVEVLGSINEQAWPEVQHMPDFHKVGRPEQSLIVTEHCSRQACTCRSRCPAEHALRSRLKLHH